MSSVVNNVIGYGTGAVAAAAGIVATNLENITGDNIYKKAVAKWLDMSLQVPALAWGAILGTATVSGGSKLGKNYITSNSTAWIGSMISSTVSSSEVLSKAIPGMNYVYKVLADPNIGGIPIGTASIATERTVDVSQSLVLQQSMGTKEYYTDNATPHLKEWTIEGYLTPMLGLDSFMFIKPSLMLQKKFLDVAATSRRPVWFKDNEMVFHQVQITSLQMTQEPSATNAVKITVGLKEYKPYVVGSYWTTVKKFNKLASSSGTTSSGITTDTIIASGI